MIAGFYPTELFLRGGLLKFYQFINCSEVRVKLESRKLQCIITTQSLMDLI